MPTEECHIDNCENTEFRHGMCEAHHGRWVRYGDPYHADDGYYAAHKRVRLAKGRPDEHQCAGCVTKRAAQWAYDHRDPHSEIGSNGLEYSVSLEHYIPLCIRCHKKFDALVRKMKQSVLA